MASLINILATVNGSMSLDILEQIAKSMYGKTFHHHTHILYDLRTILGKGMDGKGGVDGKRKYLEIGTFNGGSACLMLQHPYKTDIYCIDPLNVESNQLDTVTKNFSKFNTYDRKINLIRGYSCDFSNVLGNLLHSGETFDLILIDGSHKYRDVIADFVNYYSLLNEGGFLVFDDYNDKEYSPEVKGAVDDICLGIKNNKFVGTFDIIGSISNGKKAKPKEMVNGNCFILYRPISEEIIKFAVVIATYQRPNGKSKNFIRESLKSLKKQKYQNFKVFLIGDRYDDNDEFLSFDKEFPTEKLYMENLKVAHERDNCKLKRNLWTIGGANAMNHGLRKCREEGFTHMAHLDDDDTWHPNHLRNLAIAYTQFPNIVFACTKGILNNDILPYVNGYYPDNFIPKGNDCFHSSFSFNVKILPFEYQTISLPLVEEKEYEPADLVMLRQIGDFIRKSNGKWHGICAPHITCFRTQEHNI